MLPLSPLLGPLLELINGPVFSIIDKLIPDSNLNSKLKAEIRQKTISHESEIVGAQRHILLQEISQGSLLTRSWRPVLMYIIILFLLVYGLILPLGDLFTPAKLAFNPRWQEIPDGFWSLLNLGVGGYIGGRSLEKIATTVSGNQDKMHRTNNFNKP